MRIEKVHEMFIDEFTKIKLLGKGCEGSVYKTIYKDNYYTLKIFYEPINIRATLNKYIHNITKNSVGLFEIKSIIEANKIVAIYYPFINLYYISPINYLFNEDFAKIFLAHYCKQQTHLIKKYNLLLVDGSYSNFLISKLGEYYYVDYGTTIEEYDDSWGRNCGNVAYSFYSVLFSKILFPKLKSNHLNIKERTPGFRWDAPCRFATSEQFYELTSKYPWTIPIVEIIQNSDAKILLDPEFYKNISSQFPNKIENAKKVINKDKYFKLIPFDYYKKLKNGIAQIGTFINKYCFG